MADQPVTKEKLINADKDVQTIEDFIKKPKDETVTTRFGDEIMTLKGLEEEVKKSGGYFKRYTSLAAANADLANIPVDGVVKVTDAMDGGDYEKVSAGATTLTKSDYDPLAQAKAYTESFASVKTQDISNISIDDLQTLGSYRVIGANLATVSGLPFNALCDIEVHGNTISLWQTVKQNNSNNFAIRSSNGGSTTVGWNPWIYPAFKHEIPTININVFPNPSLTSAKAVTYQASVIQESGEDVLQMTGSTTQQAIYEVDAVGDFAVGNTLTLSADSFADTVGHNLSADITIIALNSAGSALAQPQADISTASAYQKLTTSLLIPANTAKVRFRFVKRAQASIAKFKSVVLTTSAGSSINKYNIDANESATIYMSLTGNDSNDGSIDKPVLTFARAIAAAGKNGKIIMRGGDYINATLASGFNVAGVESLHITTHKNEKVRVIQGIKLASITKTSGYTKVYQAPLTTITPERYLWLHDVPDVSTLIDIADRHPLQRGETYRLPSTKLWKVTSIELVESATRPSFYFDSAAKIVYFSVPSGTDALTATIYAPSNLNGLIHGGTGVEEVEISGNITMMYGGLRNVDARNLKRFKHTNLFVFGGKAQGIVLDDTLVSEGDWVRCAGNNDDGYNGHVYSVNTQCVHKCENIWTHDNGDDGESMHEYTNATYTNILSESNGDRGAAPAYGAHCTYIGYVFQNNGQETVKDGGEGIACVGASAEGVGTQAILFGGVSRGNVINYRTGAADASMKITNGHSFDATDCGFDATVGRIEITNTGDSGSTVVKRGNVVVKNTTQVT